MGLRRTADAVWVAVLLIPPWLALLLSAYWIFFDDASPVTVAYQHPRFLRWPVDSRSGANAAETDAVASGAPVWIYREWCQHRSPMRGETASEWVSEHVEWPAPKQHITDLGIGCYSRSVGLSVPDTQVERMFAYIPRWLFTINPLVRRELVLPPITVNVLPHDFDRDAEEARKRVPSTPRSAAP